MSPKKLLFEIQKLYKFRMMIMCQKFNANNSPKQIYNMFLDEGL